MKTSLIFGLLILSLILHSCNKEDFETGSGFSIVFFDGEKITENDIEFYDTSTHLFHLKRQLNLAGKKSTFAALVNKDTIYTGIIFPSYFSSRPKEPIFISDLSIYGENILEISCWMDSGDFRNDSRIVNALKKRNLLRYGIQCNIKEIKITPYSDYSAVWCKISVKNNDNNDYYIIDPSKMGELKFNYYTGGLLFLAAESKPSSFLRWSVSNPDYNNLTINDFSVIKAGQEIEFTFSSNDYYKIENGNYKASFRFAGPRNADNINLLRKNGTIWIGSLYSVKEINVAE